MKYAILPFLAAGLLLPLAGPAAAQSGMGNSLRPNVGVAQEAPRQAPPPALPGSRATPTPVAPATRVPTDMPPTEALFDAINRGDIAGARDAIGRGADLNGHNVLGLTPLELSVDLGHNDISFLLLSLRTPSPGPTARPGAAEARAPTRAERQAAERAERAERARQARQVRLDAEAARASRTAPQAPRLFAGDGGTPVPQAGFLGFDPAR